MKYVESGSLELKEVINADFKKEIIAFANTDGGDIYVGIAKDGEVVGVEEPEGQMERISNMIRDGIKPDLAAYTAVDCFLEQGKPVIKVTVSRGDRRPYHLTDKGLKPSGVYIRHGVSAAPASDEMIRQMIKESDGTTFDKARSLNQELTFDFAEQYFEEREVDFGEGKRRSLGLINSDGYYTNAALLLSDQCEHSIKCAVYNGTGKTKFKTRKEFYGSILRQLEEAYSFINFTNNLSSDFEGLRRVDRYDYPEYALREALLNTIVHRDYGYSGSTLVNIFTDRIEFVSLGGLVKGITLTDIMHGVSQSRNMVLASIFYRLELIESYGTGIQRIQESYGDCREKPEFLPAPASFVVTLPNRNNPAKSSYLYEAPELYEANRIREEYAYGCEYTPREKVLSLFARKGTLVRKDVEKLLGCSSFPANQLLKQLVEEGVIMRVGNARATKYMLRK